MQTAYQNGGTFIVILIKILNDYYLFYLVLAGNNELFRVSPFFFFVSIGLSICQSACVSVDLFTNTLTFLKTHNYWLAQIVRVSLASGLEFKMCRLHIKMLRNFSKKIKGDALVPGFGTKQPLQQFKFLLLFWLLFVLSCTSCWLAAMISLGWHYPHLVDSTDTHCL